MRLEDLESFLTNVQSIDVTREEDGEIIEGIVNYHNGHCHPVTDGILRAGQVDYTESFGFQWNRFRLTQLDSHTGLRLSHDRLVSCTGWNKQAIEGSSVLELGAGPGRFTEWLIKFGAKVVAVDSSIAIDANAANLNFTKQALFIQGDLYDLPLRENAFDYVLMLGVLQHLPDKQRAVAVAYSYLNKLRVKNTELFLFQDEPGLMPRNAGGRLCVDVYLASWKPSPFSWPKYFWRPLTTILSFSTLMQIIRWYIPKFINFNTFLRRQGKFGRIVLSMLLIPCWNYCDRGLSREQRIEWSVLDTFDALSPDFDSPMTKRGLQKLLHGIGVQGYSVDYGGNGLVARIW